MKVHVSGRVIEEIKEGKYGGRYRILSDGEEYEVIVYGRQAFKDYLFVRKNQQVEIDGILEAKKIFLQKVKICLNNSKEKKTNMLKDDGKGRNEDTKETESGCE